MFVPSVPGAQKLRLVIPPAAPGPDEATVRARACVHTVSRLRAVLCGGFPLLLLSSHGHETVPRACVLLSRSGPGHPRGCGSDSSDQVPRHRPSHTPSGLQGGKGIPRGCHRRPPSQAPTQELRGPADTPHRGPCGGRLGFPFQLCLPRQGWRAAARNEPCSFCGSVRPILRLSGRGWVLRRLPAEHLGALSVLS